MERPLRKTPERVVAVVDGGRGQRRGTGWSGGGMSAEGRRRRQNEPGWAQAGTGAEGREPGRRAGVPGWLDQVGEEGRFPALRRTLKGR